MVVSLILIYIFVTTHDKEDPRQALIVSTGKVVCYREYITEEPCVKVLHLNK